MFLDKNRMAASPFITYKDVTKDRLSVYGYRQTKIKNENT